MWVMVVDDCWYIGDGGLCVWVMVVVEWLMIVVWLMIVG